MTVLTSLFGRGQVPDCGASGGSGCPVQRLGAVGIVFHRRWRDLDDRSLDGAVVRAEKRLRVTRNHAVFQGFQKQDGSSALLHGRGTSCEKAQGELSVLPS